MLRRDQASESDGDNATETSPPPAPTPDSDENHQKMLVTVPPLEKTVFITWDEFNEYLAEYQQRTFQVYSVRTATPVSTRNKRIKERYAQRGLAVPPGELLPEEMGTYSKAVVCTHSGRPRSRATGVRAIQPSRAINCPARITMVLRRDYTSGKCFVHVSSHTTRHNHALSDGQYRRHPMIRKITDPHVLQTVRALQKANVQPSKILEYVHEHTDKQVTLRDVHNLLASFRKSPPPPPSTSVSAATPTSGASAATASSVPVSSRPRTQISATPPAIPTPTQPPIQASATTDQSLRFTVRGAPRQSPHANHFPTQYGKFLAAFNVGKEIAELMAEMDPDRYAHCFAELRMLLRIAESGRVPVVTTREAVEHVQNNVMTGIPNTPIPQQQAFQVSSAPTSSLPSGASAPNKAARNSLITPSQPYSSG